MGIALYTHFGTRKKKRKEKRKKKLSFATRKPSFEYFGCEEFPSPITKANDLGENVLPAKRGKITSGLSLENEAINPLKLN